MNDLMTKSFLKKQAGKDIEPDPEDLEVGRHLDPRDEQNLLQFFQEVEGIRSEMREITDLLRDLEYLNEQSKSTYSNRALRGLRDQMDSDMVTILRKANEVKTLLGTLNQSNLSNRGICKSYKEGSRIDRTRVSVSNGLRVRLREMMNDFQSLRDKVVLDHREDMKRRYYNATGEEATEEVVDRVIVTGGNIQLFGGKAEMMVGSTERHQTVMDLQRSLKKLHQVFLDMAVMVETQGEEVVKGIEEKVAKAGGCISGGTNSVYYANQMRRKGKKEVVQFWVWAVVLVMLLVCLVSLLVY